MDLINCRRCNCETCHVPDDADPALKRYDGLCPKCALHEAAQSGDSSMIDALGEVVSASVRIAVEVLDMSNVLDEGEDVTPEHIYQHIMEFLRRYPELRKRMQYELSHAEIITTPMQRNDPRFG